MSFFRIALVSAALLLAPVLATAEPLEESGSDLEQVLVESASTPQQHQALAAHFRAKAAAARREAERHRHMGRSYSGGKLGTAQALTQHCRKLAELSDSMAAEYTKLAETHEEAAKKAAKE